MPTRRDILKQTCAAALGVTCSTHIAQPARGASTPVPPGRPGPQIRSVVRRDETILRLGGLGDGYDMTWDAQGRQYVAVNDGTGWIEQPTAFYNTRLWTLNDRLQDGAHAAVSGYPELN